MEPMDIANIPKTNGTPLILWAALAFGLYLAWKFIESLWKGPGASGKGPDLK